MPDALIENFSATPHGGSRTSQKNYIVRNERLRPRFMKWREPGLLVSLADESRSNRT
jgi:hypothetical protein